MSSIKYFDLKQNRINDYVFDFDRMLDPEGDTGVYLLYQYVRISSIIEKSQFGSPEALAAISQSETFAISDPKEKELALTILRLPEQLDLAINDLQINRVCDLVYDIAVKIGQYYSAVQVRGSPEEASRILLLESVRKVMAVCFDLLAMKTISKI
jgi:arginyl-tRNA synthetase